MRRHDFHTHPCPKCGAGVGQPCISANGREQAWNVVHVLRLRVRSQPPDKVQIRHVYPRRPRAIGVLLVTPAGVQVLATLVPGR